MEALKQKKVGRYLVTVTYDEDSECPREWDILSTIYSNHRRINPDKHTIDELLDEKSVLDLDGKVGLMIWLSEHSNYRFKTSEIDDDNPFGDGMYARFDSGQFGVIAMPIETAKKEWGEDWENMAKDYMKNEIEAYNKWANGWVYRFVVEDIHGDWCDGCGGFYDIDEALNEGVDSAQTMVECDKQEIEERLDNATLQQLKDKFYEMATTAPAWVDEVFELVEEDKAVEWFKTKLRNMIEDETETE